MFKKSISILLAIIIMIGILTVYPFTTSVYAAISNPASTPRITYAGQVVDSITYRGSTINAVYTPYRDGLATDWTYGCFVLPRTFYSTIYGITVSNLNSTTSIPNASSGYFQETRSPRKGDIVRCNNYVHWALVKEVNGTTVTIIQQNAWWNSYTCAQVGNTVSSSDLSVSFFTYSGYLPDWNPDPTPDFTPVDVGTDFYANIVCLSSGKVATVSNNNVILGSKNGDNNQKWRFERQGDTSYKIINVETGYCLDVSNASSANETNIQICPSNDTNAQRWFFKAVSNGYSLVPKCAMNSCLDIYSGLTDDGTNIQLFQQNSTEAQIFDLNAQPSFSAINLGRDFTSYIVYNESGSVVTVDSSGNVVVRPYNGSLIQRWNFHRMSDRAYKITNAETGKCLDVQGGYSTNKSNIWTHTSNDTAAQRWFVRFNGHGYSFVPKCAVNSAMDLDNGIIDNNSNIQIYSFIEEGVHQVFSLQYTINAIEVKTYNGNTYVEYNYEIPWREAYRYCEQQGGHLVTIDSLGEQKFIYDLLNNTNSRKNLWLGALDAYSEGTWNWITGDAIRYSNWADGEPNNNNDEDYMVMYRDSGKWNDAHDIYNDFTDSYCFICEFENQSFIPSIVPEKSFEYNNHQYEFYSYCVDWQTAERFCEQKGGHLVTITDSAENNAIKSNATGLSRTRYWIGLTDINHESQWEWVTGEKRTFTNWEDGEPNNAYGVEDYAEYYLSNGKWNDTKGFSCTYLSIGFICEYDTTLILGDADGDGVVTILDATAIQRHLAELPTKAFIEKSADADEDGTVTILDVTSIQRHLAELPTNKRIGALIK